MTKTSQNKLKQIVSILSNYIDPGYLDDFTAVATITKRLNQINLLSNLKKDNNDKFIYNNKAALSDISEVDDLISDIDEAEGFYVLEDKPVALFDCKANPIILEKMMEKYVGELQVLLVAIFNLAYYFAYEITEPPTDGYFAEKIFYMYQLASQVDILFSDDFLSQFEEQSSTQVSNSNIDDSSNSSTFVSSQNKKIIN